MSIVPAIQPAPAPVPESGAGPALAVIVVNFGSHELIERNIPALLEAASAVGAPAVGPLAAGSPAKAAPGRVHVVIVDNHHSAGETAAIAEVCARRGWEIVLNDHNAGFGAAMNAGVDRARSLGCAVYLLINPDATLTPAGVRRLYARVLEHPLTLRSPRIVTGTGARWFDGGTVSIERGTTRTSPGSDSSAPRGWLSGACLMVSEQLWSRVGGFDDRYFLYWEDVDLSWRCVAAGGALAVDRDVVAVHSVGGTQRGTGKSSSYVYFNCRNRMLFAGTHLLPPERRSWGRLSARYAWAVLGRGGRRALARRSVPLGAAAVRGTLAGRRLAFGHRDSVPRS